MKTLLLIVFTVLYGTAIAQPRVITFESDENSKEEGYELEKNVVKMSLLELVSGDFPIYYERALNDYFSAEVSLGVTFGDYLGSISNDLNSSPFEDNVDARYGFSFSAAIRFYPIATLEDFYISPEFKYRKYNWNTDVEKYNPENEFVTVSTTTVAEDRTYSMPRINLGYVLFYDNNLTFDYYLGLGMNTPTETVYDYNEQKVVHRQNNTRPRFHIGFKVGYVF